MDVISTFEVEPIDEGGAVNFVTGTLFRGSAAIGTLSGHLIDRSQFDDDGDFVEEADEESSELGEFAEQLVSGPMALATGSALHIDVVTIEPPERGAGLGLVFVRQLLDKLQGRWGVVGLNPAPASSTLSAVDQEWQRHHGPEPLSPEASAARQSWPGRQQRAAARLAIHWGKLGFKAGPGGKFCWLDPPGLRALLKMMGPLSGKIVVVNGLTSRPELNGRTGRVMSWNAAKDRYGVQFEPQAQPLSIKTERLTACAE